MTVRRAMPREGPAHVLKAFGYSLAGARVLLREEAARLEIILFVVAAALFFASGVHPLHYLALIGLFFFILMVEAINTAIEYIVDRTSPEISEFGKHTKDVASFAVFCSLVIFCGYATTTLAVTLL